MKKNLDAPSNESGKTRRLFSCLPNCAKFLLALIKMPTNIQWLVTQKENQFKMAHEALNDPECAVWNPAELKDVGGQR